MLEILRILSRRAQDLLREQAEEAGVRNVGSGPLLQAIQAADSPKPPRCAVLERERRLADARQRSLLGRRGSQRRADFSRQATLKAPGTIRDARGALQCRISPLACEFMNSEYEAALLLHASLQAAPADTLSKGSDALANWGYWVPLEIVQRQHAWARLSGYSGSQSLSGSQWHAVLERVLSKNSWSLEQRGGEAGIVGVQRVHPRDRKPPLGGWDVLQLLQLFGCGSLDELPWAAEPTLRALPSASLRF
ncbi:MAG: hypothetical protein CBD47_08280 [Synechococcus sp. TMED187]|nr:MAG: hypothetical protein CBD47_08280 [Synechococcus sp. TMED187]